MSPFIDPIHNEGDFARLCASLSVADLRKLWEQIDSWTDEEIFKSAEDSMAAGIGGDTVLNILEMSLSVDEDGAILDGPARCKMVRAESIEAIKAALGPKEAAMLAVHTGAGMAKSASPEDNA